MQHVGGLDGPPVAGHDQAARGIGPDRREQVGDGRVQVELKLPLAEAERVDEAADEPDRDPDGHRRVAYASAAAASRLNVSLDCTASKLSIQS